MGAVDDAVAAWGASGLAHLTGHAAGPADFSRAAVLTLAQKTADAYRVHTGIPLDAATLLTGRAALLGWARRGRVSAGGASRLFPALDGWCALTLARADDVDAVPALVEADSSSDPWRDVLRWASVRPAADVVERARLLDLPAARLAEAAPAAHVVRRVGEGSAPRGAAGLLVVDLSVMWAGPLCGRLLADAGATVVKVESYARPDGTRAGAPEFFDWMNHAKLCYAAEFSERSRLKGLLECADVVLESARPDALARRGLGPDDVAAKPGRVWLRVTGHGAVGDASHWVAFGDDAAVSGGLVGEAPDGPVFCADAIADPLTGLHAAVAVLDALARGGGEVVDVAMAGVAAGYARLGRGPSVASAPVRASTAPPRSRPAAALGADNDLVEGLIAERGERRC